MIKVLLPYRTALSRGPVRMVAPAAMACALLALSAGSAFAAPGDQAADGRAYEMATPPDKNGIGVTAAFTTPRHDGGNDGGSVTGAYLSPDGNALMFSTHGALPGSESAVGYGRYLAHRSSTGWATKPIDPPNLADSTFLRPQLTYGTSEDGSRAVVWSNMKLAPGGVDHSANLYLRDTITGSYELIASDPQLGNGSDFTQTVRVTQASPDLSTLIIDSPANLTPEQPPIGPYVWREGRGMTRLQVQPDGAPEPLAAGPNDLSRDGRRIVAGVGGTTLSTGALYLFEDGRPPVQISASQRTGDDPGVLHPAILQGMSRDGTSIYFRSDVALTDATDVDGSAALYEYDVRTGTLTDVLPDVPPADRLLHSTVDASPSLVSDDGSTIYFLAPGAFRPGAVAGHSNLYMARHGSVRFVADLSPDGLSRDSMQVSSDGRYVAMQMRSKLTSYDNSNGSYCVNQSGTLCAEIYVYDADTDTLSCASCNPDGSPPQDYAMFAKSQAPINWQFGSNALNDDGRVSFDTQDALLPQDTNNKRDVYTWKDGELSLVSTGTDGSDAIFESMSDDGSSIAFATNGRLVGQDVDSVMDIYVARVGGGFVSQAGPPPAPAPCADDGCQGPPMGSAPVSPIGSITFSGAGNALPPVPAERAAVTVSKLKTVTGTSATLKVKVSAAGGIRVNGASIVKVTKAMNAAGTADVSLRLTGNAQRTLKRKRSLRAAVTITFTPNAGAPVSKKLTVTFKRPVATKRGARS